MYIYLNCLYIWNPYFFSSSNIWVTSKPTGFWLTNRLAIGWPFNQPGRPRPRSHNHRSPIDWGISRIFDPKLMLNRHQTDFKSKIDPNRFLNRSPTSDPISRKPICRRCPGGTLGEMGGGLGLFIVQHCYQSGDLWGSFDLFNFWFLFLAMYSSHK